MKFKNVQKRKIHFIGLKSDVITHLSDYVTQTLCKIMLLGKSAVKVFFYFSPSTVQVLEFCMQPCCL